MLLNGSQNYESMIHLPILVFLPQTQMFLVGALSLKEKKPTITVGSFFSLQSHSEWSTFLTISQVLQFLYKFLQFEVVLLHHLRNSTGPKGTPFNFLIFSDRMDVEKSQRVPLSVFSAL